MTNGQRLFAVRAVHSVIYVVMASAALAMLWAGVTGAKGVWLQIAQALVAGEAVIFVSSGMRCPLTAVAERYGASRDGAIFDTFLPDSITRHTLAVFGPIILVAAVLLVLRWMGLL